MNVQELLDMPLNHVHIVTDAKFVATILRAPGGWVYYICPTEATSTNGVTSCFVPELPQRTPIRLVAQPEVTGESRPAHTEPPKPE